MRVSEWYRKSKHAFTYNHGIIKLNTPNKCLGILSFHAVEVACLKSFSLCFSLCAFSVCNFPLRVIPFAIGYHCRQSLNGYWFINDSLGPAFSHPVYPFHVFLFNVIAWQPFMSTVSYLSFVCIYLCFEYEMQSFLCVSEEFEFYDFCLYCSASCFLFHWNDLEIFYIFKLPNNDTT